MCESLKIYYFKSYCFGDIKAKRSLYITPDKSGYGFFEQHRNFRMVQGWCSKGLTFHRLFTLGGFIFAR